MLTLINNKKPLQIFFILNLICFNLICFNILFFDYDQMFFITLAISLICLILCVLSTTRNFCAALFLFLTVLPINSLLPMFINPLWTLLIITLVIAYPFYKKELLTFFTLGKINNPKIWLSIISVSIVSSVSLVLWGIWSDYLGSVADNIASFRSYNTLLILALVLVFAASNAVIEEVIFRGIILTELSKILNNSLAILFQAFLFASFHVAGGFPNGKIGYIMVLIYGLFLGYMRYRTKGLLASIITHIFADSTIILFIWFYFI